MTPLRLPLLLHPLPLAAARPGVSPARGRAAVVLLPSRTTLRGLSRVFGMAEPSSGPLPERGGTLVRDDFEAGMNRMSKWLVAALFGLLILWKHDAEALWAAMGSVLNSWLSVVLKRLLNHQRPSALRSDPGMPSSHAQSIFYAVVFSVLLLFRWQGIQIFSLILGAAMLGIATYLSWLRVSQQLHSLDQVLVGAVIGSSCSATWFWLWHLLVLKAFISSILVRIVVVFSSVAFCLGFLGYVLRHWLEDEG